MDWHSAKNILCIRLDSLGDVLMTSPAFRALKECGEHRKITLLTSPVGARVAHLIPEIDDVISYDPPWMKASPQRMNSLPEHKMARMLERRQFDAAVIFTVYSQTPFPAAMLCYLANIPLRLAACRENPYQLLTDWVVETEPNDHIRHEVQRQLDLVRTVGALVDDDRIKVQISEEDCRKVRESLTQSGLFLTDRWIVIHPGASAPSRRYDPDKFAVVCRRLKTIYGLTSIFTGTFGEIELVENIRAQAGVESISLAGKLSLGQLAALLSFSPLLLSNNSGPVHLSAAVGTPVVDLYALTNPQHIPWKVPNRVLNHDVPCKYCYKSICPLGHHACLSRVEPGVVIRAVTDLLRATGHDVSSMLAKKNGKGRYRHPDL